MTNRVNLSQARVRAMPPPIQGREIVYDNYVPGFGVRITPNGVKSFILRRKVDGRAQIITLDRFPAISVETARKMAQEINGAFARGENPQVEKNKRRVEQTIAELFQHYLDGWAKAHTRTWVKAEALYRRHVKPWANRRISSITNSEVRALHSRIGRNHGTYSANRVLQLIKTTQHWLMAKERKPISMLV